MEYMIIVPVAIILFIIAMFLLIEKQLEENERDEIQKTEFRSHNFSKKAKIDLERIINQPEEEKA